MVERKCRLIITVKEVWGRCPLYLVDDKMVIEGFYINTKESKNICMHAFLAMSSLLSAFIHGSSAKELGIGLQEDIGHLRCPDPGPPYTKGGSVLFELRRELIKDGYDC